MFLNIFERCFISSKFDFSIKLIIYSPTSDETTEVGARITVLNNEPIKFLNAVI